MPTWSPDQYLKFTEERTRPCRELAERIDVASVRRVIDIGCGPGNSTEVLAARWPDAEITGLDNSAEMIAAARKSQPARRWVVREIADWAASNDGNESRGQFDVVFSNAALHWLPDHAVLYPRLLARTAPGGTFAAQIPGNFDAPAHEIMRDITKLRRGAIASLPAVCVSGTLMTLRSITTFLLRMRLASTSGKPNIYM